VIVLIVVSIALGRCHNLLQEKINALHQPSWYFPEKMAHLSIC